MEGYGHNGASLLSILQRLQAQNSRNSDTLSEHYSYQQNQITSLHSLGIVEAQSGPANGGGVKGTDSEKIAGKQDVFQALVRELDKMDLQGNLLISQTRDAKFISDALYRQIQPEKDLNPSH